MLTFIGYLLLLNKVCNEYYYGAFEDQSFADDFPRVRVLIDLVDIEQACRVLSDRPPVFTKLHKFWGQVGRGGRGLFFGVTEGEVELPNLDFLEHYGFKVDEEFARLGVTSLQSIVIERVAATARSLVFGTKVGSF